VLYHKRKEEEKKKYVLRKTARAKRKKGEKTLLNFAKKVEVFWKEKKRKKGIFPKLLFLGKNGKRRGIYSFLRRR